jgi:hypothetical protein
MEMDRKALAEIKEQLEKIETQKLQISQNNLNHILLTQIQTWKQLAEGLLAHQPNHETRDRTFSSSSVLELLKATSGSQYRRYSDKS